jgi:hypothetical protein
LLNVRRLTEEIEDADVMDQEERYRNQTVWYVFDRHNVEQVQLER